MAPVPYSSPAQFTPPCNVQTPNFLPSDSREKASATATPNRSSRIMTKGKPPSSPMALFILQDGKCETKAVPSALRIRAIPLDALIIQLLLVVFKILAE